MEKRRLKKNLALVEFVANKEFIDEMVEKGYPLNAIHEMLVKDRGVKMAYSTFLFRYRKSKEINMSNTTNKNIIEKNNNPPGHNIIGQNYKKDVGDPTRYQDKDLLKKGGS